MTTDIVPKPRGTGPNGGRPAVYPDSTVKRALELMLETHSAAVALHMLERELPEDQVPAYPTLWGWAKQSQDVINALQSPEKREMVAMAQDVASAASKRMLEALPELSHSQIPVAYGIAMQRRTDWENAGSAAPTTAIQINLVDSKGKGIPEV